MLIGTAGIKAQSCRSRPATRKPTSVRTSGFPTVPQRHVCRLPDRLQQPHDNVRDFSLTQDAVVTGIGICAQFECCNGDRAGLRVTADLSIIRKIAREEVQDLRDDRLVLSFLRSSL